MKRKYLGIEIDYSRDKRLTEQALVLLTKKGFYKKDGENSPQESFARAATCYCFGDYELAQRIYDAVSKGWFTFASPVLSNAIEIEWPTFDEKHMNFNHLKKWLKLTYEDKHEGMPISCFLSNIPDTKEGLVSAREEISWLSMLGGGVGMFPSMRSPDTKSTGVMSHLRGYDADALSYKQTESRRGSLAPYMDINHPEILSFMQMRNPIGGDPNSKCFNLNHGVNISDEFMYKMFAGEDYELIDPKHGPTGRMLNAADVWEELMVLRKETGEPFIKFTDTVNRNIPKHITHPLYRVVQSNLCSEITLYTSAKRTAVCCLSSPNLEMYDEWKDAGLIEDVVKFLDNVLEYFIQLAPPELRRAVHSATKERALGVGFMGWHSFLQSRMIPFESGGVNSAMQWNKIIFSELKRQGYAASRKLAKERGEPSDCEGSGMRNSHIFAIAPNASSSDINGVSPGIEPQKANGFMSKGRAGLFVKKNKHLDEVLRSYISCEDELNELWRSIIVELEGSVQHLTFLSDLERKVFKTAVEIDSMYVVEQAAMRQPEICQSQSLNIFVREGITAQRMSDIHVAGWEKGVKTFYYCRAEEAVVAKISDSNVTPPLNAVPVEIESKYGSGCLGCDG